MDAFAYYNRYWDQDEPPPEADPTTPIRERLLVEALAPLRNGAGRPVRVLDAGCGAGWFVGRLSRAGFAAEGVDVSSSAVERALAANPGASIEVLSLESRVPRPDGYYDAVWSTEVIEHLFDVQAFAAEMARLIRPGGRLVLTTPYHGLLKNVAIALAGFDGHFDVNKSHIRFFSVRRLRDVLSKAGFRVLWWKGFGRPWPLYKSMFVVAGRLAE